MSISDQYILNAEGVPVLAESIEQWGKWYESAVKDGSRKVALETIGDARISTVFLAMDHAWGDEPGPVLWETMVFGGPLDQEQDRCSGIRANAESMHARMVERVRSALALPPMEGRE